MIHADDDRALNILIDATAEVVGTVSKVYQTIKLAVEGGRLDLLAAARAFDELPAYQRQRIAEIAAAHADAPRARGAGAPGSADAFEDFPVIETRSAASLLDDWDPRGAAPSTGGAIEDGIDAFVSAALEIDAEIETTPAPDPEPAAPTRAAIPDPLDDPWPVHDWELEIDAETATRQ